MPRLLTLVLAAGAAAASAQTSGGITAAEFMAHVRTLAADDMGGRGNGTAELERAADYVSTQFRAAGLLGGGDDGSYDQVFTSDVHVEPPSTSTVTVTYRGVAGTLRLGRDFHPLSAIEGRPEAVPSAKVVDAPLVFAGYGISAPGLGYDDYAALDVRGAAVLVMTHEPQEGDARSVFAGRDLTPGAALAAKAREARARGAAMLLVVDDPSHIEDRAVGPTWWADPQREPMGLSVIRVSRDQIRRLVPALDLDRVAARIDRTLSPESQPIAGASVTYVEQLAEYSARLRNVIGLLRGADPDRSSEAIVVAAHYDHLGRGGALSSAPEATGDIHNGADDNASGVAALVEIAGAAARAPARLARTVVFAAFAGEELGLRGSARYVSSPPIPLARTRAMIDLDMVGRAHGRVLVGVFDRRGTLGPLIRRLRPWTRLALLDFSRGGYGEEQSDLASFTRAGVPSVAFFTGFHADYHRPTDDWPLVDGDGGAEVARLAFRLLQDLAR